MLVQTVVDFPEPSTRLYRRHATPYRHCMHRCQVEDDSLGGGASNEIVAAAVHGDGRSVTPVRRQALRPRQCCRRRERWPRDECDESVGLPACASTRTPLIRAPRPHRQAACPRRPRPGVGLEGPYLPSLAALGLLLAGDPCPSARARCAPHDCGFLTRLAGFARSLTRPDTAGDPLPDAPQTRPCWLAPDAPQHHLFWLAPAAPQRIGNASHSG